jgi:hypothetical protein
MKANSTKQEDVYIKSGLKRVTHYILGKGKILRFLVTEINWEGQITLTMISEKNKHN